MIVIFLLSLCGFDPHPPTFCWLARFHYASITFTSSGGIDPPPPTVVGTHPLRFNDSIALLHIHNCPQSGHFE